MNSQKKPSIMLSHLSLSLSLSLSHTHTHTHTHTPHKHYISGHLLLSCPLSSSHCVVQSQCRWYNSLHYSIYYSPSSANRGIHNKNQTLIRPAYISIWMRNSLATIAGNGPCPIAVFDGRNIVCDSSTDGSLLFFNTPHTLSLQLTLFEQVVAGVWCPMRWIQCLADWVSIQCVVIGYQLFARTLAARSMRPSFGKRSVAKASCTWDIPLTFFLLWPSMWWWSFLSFDSCVTMREEEEESKKQS